MLGLLRRRGRTHLLPIHEVVRSFESLGDNCEFGLVQRYAGAEPLGLLRFSATRLDALVEALDSDFEGYGTGDDLALFENEAGAYVCASRRYGFAYGTGARVADTDSSKLFRRETTKAGYLKRRLLEDLASGGKILLRKAAREDAPEDVLRLARAVRRHGGCRLLWVRERGDAPANPPRLHDATLIEDTVERFAPDERAHALDLAPWLVLCRRIHGLVHGLPDALDPARSSPAARRRRLPEAARGPVLHGVSADEEIIGEARRSGHLDHTRIHTYSVWVWVPADFVGRRIGAMIGHHRLAFRDADLALRDGWQRVWIAAQWPERHHRLAFGLVVSGAAGSCFWSAGERLDEGPVPGPASPPRSAPRPATG